MVIYFVVVSYCVGVACFVVVAYFVVVTYLDVVIYLVVLIGSFVEVIVEVMYLVVAEKIEQVDVERTYWYLVLLLHLKLQLYYSVMVELYA